MKKVFGILFLAITSLVLVSCKKGYQPVINVDDFDKSWSYDASIKTTVTFAHTMSKTTDPLQGQQALLDVQKEEFTKEMKSKYNWDVEVKHEQYGGYDELKDRLAKELTTGNEPSMATGYPDHVASYIASDRVLPLDNLINNNNKEIALSQEDLDDYVPSFMKEGRSYDLSNTTLSMPFSKSTEVMFYNKTFFDKHNLTVPKTWKEVAEVSEKILKTKELPAGGVPFGYDSDDNLFIVRSAQVGAAYTGLNPETLKGEILFNNDKSKAMVESLVELKEKGYLTTKGLIGSYTSDQFKTGKLMMTVGSTGGTNHNIGGNFEVGVAPMPQETTKEDDAKTILQGPSVVLFRKGIRPAAEADKDGNIPWVAPLPTQEEKNEMIAAWMFYKFITRPENTIKQATGTGYLPVRVSAFETSTYTNYVANAKTPADKAKAQVLTLAKTLMEKDMFFVSPAFSSSSKARAAVGVLLIDALNKKGTLEQLFKRAVASAS